MAADPVSLMVMGTLAVSATSAGYSMWSAGEADKLQQQNIRAQQTALRLQKAETSLSNMNQLEHALAKQEVMSGVRNIRADSGSLAALTRETFTEFDRAERINKANFNTNQMSLLDASMASSQQKRNSQIKAGLGFAENAASMGMKYKSLMDMQTIARRSGDITPQGGL
jgi:hypothetical protein